MDNTQSSTQVPSIPKKNKNAESIMDFRLPDEEWLTEMYGAPPIDTSSNNRKQIRRPSRNGPAEKRIKLSNRLTNSTSNEEFDQQIIQISDEEDNPNEESPLVDQKQEQNPSAHENDENIVEDIQAGHDDSSDEITVLFDSIAERTSKKESIDHNEMQHIEESNKKSNPDQRIAECSSINIRKAMIPNQSKSMANNVKENATNWPRIFGVYPKPDEYCFERISKYKKNYAEEFGKFNEDIWDHMMKNFQNDHILLWFVKSRFHNKKLLRKMRVKTKLQEEIRKIYPKADFELLAFGSTVNGCGALDSDMDLCLCFLNMMHESGTSTDSANDHLKNICEYFDKQRFEIKIIQKLNYIPATVPILKMKFNHPYQTLDVDMNVNNLAGVYNSYLIHYYTRIDDRFTGIALIVKKWAKQNKILDASSGFFNSYSLILMILHFLQCGTSPPVLPNLQTLYPEYFSFNKRPLRELKLFEELPHPLPKVEGNKYSVGELLIAFFHYYANFNFEEKAISIKEGRTLLRKDLPEDRTRFKIFIEDPFDFQNTARCVKDDRKWAIIQGVFAQAVQIFTHAPELKKLI